MNEDILRSGLAVRLHEINFINSYDQTPVTSSIFIFFYKDPKLQFDRTQYQSDLIINPNLLLPNLILSLHSQFIFCTSFITEHCQTILQTTDYLNLFIIFDFPCDWQSNYFSFLIKYTSCSRWLLNLFDTQSSDCVFPGIAVLCLANG